MGLIKNLCQRAFRTHRWVLALAVVTTWAFTLATFPAHAKYASLVLDAQSGQILHEINADTRNYPASLTKMMTLYLMFEALDEKRITLDTRFKVSARAARQPSSKLNLKAGSTFSVREGILALVTKSANDVATAVAENMGGTERNFALKMTATARKLGMNSTTFRNASGLPHRAQLSTARDMARLAHALLRDYPNHYHFFSQQEFSYAGKRHKNHNKLLKTYDGVDGIKTGYIRASGFNLVASVKRNGKRLIGVVFGGDSPRMRNRHMSRLLDKGFGKIDPQFAQAQKAKQETKTAKTTSRKSTGNTERNSNPTVWGIQVGAYKAPAPARRMAERVTATVPSLLAEGVIKVVPLKKKNGKALYRARILGISKGQAYRACKVLRGKNMGCMELSTKQPLRLASSAH